MLRLILLKYDSYTGTLPSLTRQGLLSDGTIIAVKQLSSRSKQGNREFVNEIGMISALQHPNLVKLYGCCTEGNQLSLVYEYMENNCLARALFGKHTLHVSWFTLFKLMLHRTQTISMECYRCVQLNSID